MYIFWREREREKPLRISGSVRGEVACVEEKEDEEEEEERKEEAEAELFSRNFNLASSELGEGKVSSWVNTAMNAVNRE